ncbi:hypothetical protein DPMN_091225 [Dreissena polymorpha]|uniref:Uncharacterized protein n=1 Tax=Dreissena polymorpha TaxID=45954 RepID=A0A9D4KZ65_DREPO|nr:hypothetical protein DPMN_091225 [Dreissena polymorpha]
MNSEHPGGHVFQQTGYIFVHIQNIIKTNKYSDQRPTGFFFKLVQDIIGTILVTKFHEDQTINVASRVLTRKNAPPPDIIGTNLLTKFHDDRTINVASRVKNAPPPGGHVF